MENINILLPEQLEPENLLQGTIPTEANPLEVRSRFNSAYNVNSQLTAPLVGGVTYRVECYADYAVWGTRSDMTTDHFIGLNIFRNGIYINAIPITSLCSSSHCVAEFTADRDGTVTLHIASLTKKETGQITHLWGFRLYDTAAMPHETITVPVTADAIHIAELMTADHIELSWHTDVWQPLPTGAYLLYENKRYTLLEPYQPEHTDEVYFHYRPRFHAEAFTWAKYPFFLFTEQEDETLLREPSWTLTDTPEHFMMAICAAIQNETAQTWTYHVEPETAYSVGSATLTFDNVDILSALNSIAEAFGSEWWVDYASHTIHLSTALILFSGSQPYYPLLVGQNVTVPSISDNKDEEYYNRYYVFGSTRNIVQDTPTASTNTLINRRLTLNPTIYPDGYIDAEIDPPHVYSKILYFDDIYPHADLSISGVLCHTRYHKDSDGHKIDLGGGVFDTYGVYYFALVGFSFNPTTYHPVNNPDGNLIAGLSIMAYFKDGSLRGRDFELEYLTAPRQCTNVDGSRFTVPSGYYCIRFIEQGGFVIPSVSLAPHNGDTITIYNIRMPQSYVDTAQTELEEAALEHITTYEQDTATYTVESYASMFATALPALTVGSAVSLDKTLRGILFSRIKKIERKLDLPYEITLTIGNKRVKGAIRNLREQIEEANSEIDNLTTISRSIQHTQQSLPRQFSDTRQTMEALSSAMLDGFDNHISPISVSTMQTVVGDESLQFIVIDNLDDKEEMPLPLMWNSQSRSITIDYCCIIHQTLGITDLSTADNAATAAARLRWELIQFDSGALTDPDQTYYLYIVAPIYTAPDTSGWAEFLLSPTAIGLHEVADCYHFLCGFINSEQGGIRSFARMYGYTEILPGRITTSRIVSTDGNTYFDLEQGIISGNISFSQGSDADTKVQAATAAALSATNIANGAQASALDALEAADIADSKAIAAQTTADGAQTTANTANSTANTARTTANTANTNANTAKANAAAAQTAAAAADTKATSALNNIRGQNLLALRDLRRIALDSSGAWVSALIVDENGDGYLSRRNGTSGLAHLAYADWIFNLQAGVYTLSIEFAPYTVPLADGDLGIYRNTVDEPAAVYIWHPNTNRSQSFTVSQGGEYFCIFKPSAPCRIKLERGSTATPWSLAPSDVDHSLDYLRSALIDAQGADTLISGGLVLSSFLGVRDSGGYLRAGLNGSTSQPLPMIFSGREEDNSNGSFQVWNDGRVVSTDTEGNSITINKEQITFFSGGTERNVITSKSASGSISSLITGGNLPTVQTVQPQPIRILEERLHNQELDYEAHIDGTLTQYTNLITNAPLGGTVRLNSWNVVSDIFEECAVYNEQPNFDLNMNYSVSIVITLHVGNTSYPLYSTTATDGSHKEQRALSRHIAASINATSNYNFAVGQSVYIQKRVTYAFNFEAENYREVERENALSNALGRVECAFSPVTYTVSMAQYKNTMYSNAQIFASANDKYIAFSPSDLSEIILARNGRLGLSLTPHGLMQCSWSEDGTRTRTRMNPLVLVVRVNWLNGAPSVVVRYNPLDKNVSVENIAGEGKFRLNHNLGHTDYVCLGSAEDADVCGYVSTLWGSSNYANLMISDDDTGNNYSCSVSIFDYKLY